MPLVAGQRHRAGTDLESSFLLCSFHMTKGSRQAVGGEKLSVDFPVANPACYNTKLTGTVCPQITVAAWP